MREDWPCIDYWDWVMRTWGFLKLFYFCLCLKFSIIKSKANKNRSAAHISAYTTLSHWRKLCSCGQRMKSWVLALPFLTATLDKAYSFSGCQLVSLRFRGIKVDDIEAHSQVHCSIISIGTRRDYHYFLRRSSHF